MTALSIESSIIGVQKWGTVLRAPRSMVAFPELLVSPSILGSMYRSDMCQLVKDVADFDMLSIYEIPGHQVKQNTLDVEAFTKWLNE